MNESLVAASCEDHFIRIFDFSTAQCRICIEVVSFLAFMTIALENQICDKLHSPESSNIYVGLTSGHISVREYI